MAQDLWPTMMKQNDLDWTWSTESRSIWTGLYLLYLLYLLCLLYPLYPLYLL